MRGGAARRPFERTNRHGGSDDLRTRTTFAIAASLLAIAVSPHLIAQRASGAQTGGAGTWLERTPWGHPDLRGERTSEGEYGVLWLPEIRSAQNRKLRLVIWLPCTRHLCLSDQAAGLMSSAEAVLAQVDRVSGEGA
jgi:hypothetical protein